MILQALMHHSATAPLRAAAGAAYVPIVDKKIRTSRNQEWAQQSQTFTHTKVREGGGWRGDGKAEGRP